MLNLPQTRANTPVTDDNSNQVKPGHRASLEEVVSFREDSTEPPLDFDFDLLGQEVARLADASADAARFDFDALGENVAKAIAMGDHAQPAPQISAAPLTAPSVLRAPASKMRPVAGWAAGLAAVAAAVMLYFATSERGVDTTETADSATHVGDRVAASLGGKAAASGEVGALGQGRRAAPAGIGASPGPESSEGALPLEDGVAFIQARGGARRFALNGGSVLELGAGAKLKVLERSAARVRLSAVSGRTVFSVNPARRRNWTIEVGEFKVEVTGTVFTINRDRNQSLVEVSRGQVRVSGGVLGGDPTKSLNPGDQLRLEHEAEQPAPELKTRRGISAGESRKVVEGSPPERPATRGSWQSLLRQQRYAEAMKSARDFGIPGILQGGSPTQLADLADVARFSGNAGVAHRAWQKLRERHAGSAKARGAAFHLGRNAFAVGDSASAKRWFETYLRESPGGAYVGQARGRLIRLYRDSGSNEKAHKHAKAYLKGFPNGNYARVARSVLNQ